jgi:hypothetical protein
VLIFFWFCGWSIEITVFLRTRAFKHCQNLTHCPDTTQKLPHRLPTAQIIGDAWIKGVLLRKTPLAGLFFNLALQFAHSKMLAARRNFYKSRERNESVLSTQCLPWA